MLREMSRLLTAAPVRKLGYVVTGPIPGERGTYGDAYSYGYGYSAYQRQAEEARSAKTAGRTQRVSSPHRRTKVADGIRRAWALVGPRERRRLQLVALYSVLIASLDVVALVLLYALINLLNDQPVSGIAASVIHGLHLSETDRYRTALILLMITAPSSSRGACSRYWASG